MLRRRVEGMERPRQDTKDSPEQHGNDVIVAVLGAKQGLACHHLIAQHSQRPQVCSW